MPESEESLLERLEFTESQGLFFAQQSRRHEHDLVAAFRDLTSERVDLLEVCCPCNSPLSQAVIDAGGKAYRVGLHNGYDLATKNGFSKAAALLRRLRPRYIHVSPPCDPWTSQNNMNQRTEAARTKLEARRQQSPKMELNGQSGCRADCLSGHAGGEHPLRATSWKEPSFRKMVQLCENKKFRVDGCRYGMQDKHGVPIQKPWGWFSSLDTIRQALEKRCDHGNQKHASVHGPELAATAVYPPDLCKAFARTLLRNQCSEILLATQGSADRILAAGSPEEGANDTSATGSEESVVVAEQQPRERREPGGGEDDEKPEGGEEEDGSWRRAVILKKLKTIRANLGHPSNQVLVKALNDAQATPDILQAAQNFECAHCRQRGHAQPHRTSQIPSAKNKWDVDTFWWHSPHRDEKGNPLEHVVGVSMMDEASDYHTAAIIRSGPQTQRVISGREFRETFSKEWLRVLPKPGCLRFDDEGAFRDATMLQWLEAQAIRVTVVAGEAAWQVGKHSGHLEVLKENMSLLASELGPSASASEVLGLSLAAKNELHAIQGYSPNQWCFGQTKFRVQSYLGNGEHLPTQSSREQEGFQKELERAN